MNAIDFLIKEHNKVRKLLTDIDEQPHHYETKRKMFELVSADLMRHESMEQTLWYPCFKSKLPETVKHLVTEENFAEKAIKKLEALKTEDVWEKYFSKFKDDVEHHADEEESDLFPEVQKLLSESELEQIGKKMYEFKKKHTH